jgi:hypothetical protein
MLLGHLDVFGASPTRSIGRVLMIFALMSGLTSLPASVAGQQAPTTCCEQVRPPFYDAEVEALDLADGAVFMVPSALIDVAGFSAILGGKTLSAQLSDPRFRAKIYTQAVLSANAAEELTRLEPEAAQGFGGEDLLTTVTGTSSHVADAAGIAAEVTSGIGLIAAENAAIRAGKSVSAAQAAEAARFKKSLLGRGSSALGSLALAAKLASDFDDARDRVTFLGEAIRDARIAGALADLEAVLRATPGHDPAMVQGVADAQARLTRLSESRLRRMASIGADVFDANRATMAGMALGTVASGGAAMVAREVMELGVSLDEFKVQTLSIAAMHNLAAANLDQVRMLAEGGDPMLRSLSPDDIDVTRLGAFDARLAAEANASTYNMLWTDRWDKPLSIAGIGKAIGLSVAEHDTAGANLQERYRTLVTRRAQMQARLWKLALAAPATMPDGPSGSVIFKEDFEAPTEWQALSSSSADRRTSLGVDPQTGSYVTETYDVGQPWYAIGLSPEFAPVRPDESFQLTFKARPEVLSWGEYPSLRLWDGNYEVDRGLPHPPALVVNVSWSDNTYRKWRLVAITDEDRNPRNLSRTIPEPYGEYAFDIRYDAARDTLSWTIRDASGAVFHEATLKDIVLQSGFRHVFVGEVQGGAKYGSGARVRWDDITIRRGLGGADE